MKVPHQTSNFKPAPAGNHIARLISIIDVGLQDGGQYKDAHKLNIVFELCNELMEDGRPFTISRFYTLSLNKKASLCQMIEAMAGQTIPEDKKAEFDLDVLLGKACMVQVVVEKNDKGEERAKIKTVGAVPKGMTVPPPVNKVTSYDSSNPNQEVFDGLSDWMKAKITEGVRNLKAMRAGGTFVKSDKPDAGGSDDDDIPF